MTRLRHQTKKKCDTCEPVIEAYEGNELLQRENELLQRENERDPNISIT